MARRRFSASKSPHLKTKTKLQRDHQRLAAVVVDVGAVGLAADEALAADLGVLAAQDCPLSESSKTQRTRTLPTIDPDQRALLLMTSQQTYRKQSLAFEPKWAAASTTGTATSSYCPQTTMASKKLTSLADSSAVDNGRCPPSPLLYEPTLTKSTSWPSTQLEL